MRRPTCECYVVYIEAWFDLSLSELIQSEPSNLHCPAAVYNTVCRAESAMVVYIWLMQKYHSL